MIALVYPCRNGYANIVKHTLVVEVDELPPPKRQFAAIKHLQHSYAASLLTLFLHKLLLEELAAR